MALRHAYSKHNPADYAEHDFGPSATKQSFKDECDVNQIMKKYQKTGVIDHVSRYGGDYGFADSHDFHEAMSLVADANTMFEELPSAAREHFDNDPAKFLDFVDTMDEIKDRPLLEELGMIDTQFQQPEAPPEIERGEGGELGRPHDNPPAPTGDDQDC